MRKALIIPERGILEHKPATRFAKTTPTFALVAVPTDPARRVQVSTKTKILFVRYEIWIRRIHVGLWWVGWLFVQRRVEIWWIGEVRKVRCAAAMAVSIALEETEESLRRKRSRYLQMERLARGGE
jgi:hypothetical protein